MEDWVKYVLGAIGAATIAGVVRVIQVALGYSRDTQKFSMEAMRDMLARLQIQNDTLQTEIISLRLQNENLQVEIASLKSEIVMLRGEMEEIDRILHEKDKTITDLKAKIGED